MSDPEVFRVLSIVALVGVVAFIAVFAREPWHRSNFGRSLMVTAIAILLFSTTSVLRHWFGPDYWGYHEIRIVANVLIAYAVWTKLNTLVEARRAFRLADLDRQKREADD